MVNNEKTKPSGKLQSILLLVVVCFIVAIPQVSAFDWTDDIVSYYKLDDNLPTTKVIDELGLNNGTIYGGDNTDDISSTGIINTAFDFNHDGSNEYIPLGDANDFIGNKAGATVSMWIKPDVINQKKYLISSEDGWDNNERTMSMYFWDDDHFTINCRNTSGTGGSVYVTSATYFTVGVWAHVVGVYDGAYVRMYIDGVEVGTASALTGNLTSTTHDLTIARLGIGNYYYYDGLMDEVGIWERGLSPTEVLELYNSGDGLAYIYTRDVPTVTLDSPINASIISDVGTNFSVSGNNLSSISANWTNVTYNIWYDNSTVFNSTTVDFTDNETFNQTLIFGGFTNGNYMWNAEACYTNITGSSCISAIANYTFEWRPFEIISQSYNEYVYETDRQRFNITINTLPEVLNVDTKLNYNGTLYSATTSCASGFCNIYSIIDIPLITSGESINRSLFWSITVYDGTGTYTFNTSDEIKQQNITRIHLEECAGVYTTTTLNFTAYYETNLTRINPFYIAGTFDTWLGSGAIYRTQSFNKASTADLKLCITPTTKNQYSNAQIDYKFENENITFILRNYFFQNKTLTNISEEINLFLLEAEDSTSFIIKVQDQKLSPVVDALVYIQKYYPSDGEYRTVQIARTDSNGETIGFYETETVDYKHIIIKNGETLLETAKQKVVGKSVPFTLTFTIGTSLGFPWTSFEDNQNVSINLTFDKDTNIVTMTYIENITGSITSGQLLVIKNSLTNSTSTIICNKTSTEASVTLTCDLSAYDGTFTAIAYINGGSEKIIEFIITDARDVFGSDGLFLGMMIIMVGGFAMMWNPSAGIVSINAAVIFVNLIGFITVSPIFIFGMISVSVITIILLKT